MPHQHLQPLFAQSRYRSGCPRSPPSDRHRTRGTLEVSPGYGQGTEPTVPFQATWGPDVHRRNRSPHKREHNCFFISKFGSNPEAMHRKSQIHTVGMPSGGRSPSPSCYPMATGHQSLVYVKTVSSDGRRNNRSGASKLSRRRTGVFVTRQTMMVLSSSVRFFS